MKKLKSKILIVDDSMEQIDFLTEILIDNYEIICAFNGSKAIELARKKPHPDLILLDIIMPEPDGYEVCEILQSDVETRNIPIIFTTGFSSCYNRFEESQTGAVDFIQKPYDIEQVNSRVRDHLLIKHQKDQLTNLK